MWVVGPDSSHLTRAPIFPRFCRFPRKWSFRIREKKTNPRKKIRPNVFLKRQLKLTQTASKLQRRADDRILQLVFALRFEISRDQLVAIVFWVKMPRSDFVHRHEAAFRDFHIFLVGALLDASYFLCNFRWSYWTCECPAHRWLASTTTEPASTALAGHLTPAVTSALLVGVWGLLLSFFFGFLVFALLFDIGQSFAVWLAGASGSLSISLSLFSV